MHVGPVPRGIILWPNSLMTLYIFGFTTEEFSYEFSIMINKVCDRYNKSTAEQIETDRVINWSKSGFRILDIMIAQGRNH
jgi:hypothetical protein